MLPSIRGNFREGTGSKDYDILTLEDYQKTIRKLMDIERSKNKSELSVRASAGPAKLLCEAGLKSSLLFVIKIRDFCIQNIYVLMTKHICFEKAFSIVFSPYNSLILWSTSIFPKRISLSLASSTRSSVSGSTT